MNPLRLLNWYAIALIVLYQLTLSRLLQRLGVRCRHFPSCSGYAVLAYGKHSFSAATVLTWRRFCDCRPGSGRPVCDLP
ncbi:MAG: membrane protein insertion efficiency factor YidD [Gemmataceae bacterium]